MDPSDRSYPATPIYPVMQVRQQLVAVVDNHAGTLNALERLLSAHGIHVLPFPSAEAFLASTAARDATCLVLDIHLDGMSGLELRRQLTASGSAVPVIFMTGFDSPATHLEAVEAGCVAYLQKPFAGSSLVNAIQEAAS